MKSVCGRVVPANLVEILISLLVNVCRLVAGFYSARLYKTLRGVQWKQSALLVSIGRCIVYTESLDVLLLAFNALFTLSRISFYRQLLKQLNVASLSRPIVFLQCYSVLQLYFVQMTTMTSTTTTSSTTITIIITFMMLTVFEIVFSLCSMFF